VLTLAVILMSRMISSHDVLMQSMDGWLQGDDPTWYVVPREKGFERYLEHAPDLSATPPPASGSGGASDGKYEVSILSATKFLDPPSISVLVNLRNK
jgi:hypothetical protein